MQSVVSIWSSDWGSDYRNCDSHLLIEVSDIRISKNKEQDSAFSIYIPYLCFFESKEFLAEPSPESSSLIMGAANSKSVVVSQPVAPAVTGFHVKISFDGQEISDSRSGIYKAQFEMLLSSIIIVWISVRLVLHSYSFHSSHVWELSVGIHIILSSI